ncbi:MAG: hypothetical protein K6T83_23475, partial [Alicyclobacillus sp.]|nr:hypothetical protein [Alicyclobacillus sp.]
MKEWVSISSEDDVYLAMAVARRAMRTTSLSEMDQQMVLVSVAELTRNVLDHAGGRGNFSCERTADGIRIEVTDRGPGIKNLESLL